MRLETLDQRHPSYDADEWGQCNALYRGGKAFKQYARKFLPQNPAEPNEVYQVRLRECSYRSYIGPIIDYYVSWLFSGSFSIRAKDTDGEQTTADPYYAKFREDVGGDIDFVEFTRERVTEALIKQRSHWLLVAQTDGNPPPESKGEWEARGLGGATLSAVNREQLVDWDTDELGKLQWAIIHTVAQDRKDPRGERDLIVETWKIYDRTSVETFQLKYKPNERPKDPKWVVDRLGSVPHPFKEVPLVTLHIPDGMWIAGRTKDPQIEHFRMASALAWAIRRTCYAMPVMNLENREEPPVMGTGHYIMLGMNEKFSWSSPPSTPFDIIGKEVDSQRDEIYRITHQMAMGMDNNADTVGRSADSKEMDTAATRVMLNAYGMIISKAIEETYEILSDMRGDEAITWSIEGFSGYDTATAPELIANATNATLLGIPSKTFAREIKTKTALALLPEADQHVKDAIRIEIAEATDQDGDPLPLELQTKMDLQQSMNDGAMDLAAENAKTAVKVAKAKPPSAAPRPSST